MNFNAAGPTPGWTKSVAAATSLRSSHNQSRPENPKYAGGWSKLIRLETENGQHIGTIHEIQMPDGTVPQSHPKDYTDRDCQRFRSVNEPVE